MPSSENPPVIYHYTTIEGLLGIIQESKLFATDIFYLNDAQEVGYPASMINEFLEDLSTLYTEPHHAKMIKELAGGVETTQVLHHRFPQCVACFCVDGDLLSQWRAYAPNRGFAIGFDRSRLEPAEENAKLRPVYYDRLTQAGAIGSRMKQFMEIENVADPAKITAEMLDCAGDLWWTAAWFKSDAFSEEHEWRYVTAVNAVDAVDRFKFRRSSIGVTPYVEVEIAKGPMSSIVEVVIGPTALSVEAERAVRLLLRSMNLEHVTIRQSRISLR